MVWVLPTPGAYPRNSLNVPVFFAGEHSSSHCSGVLGIAIIVVEMVKGYKVGVEAAVLGGPRERGWQGFSSIPSSTLDGSETSSRGQPKAAVPTQACNLCHTIASCTQRPDADPDTCSPRCRWPVLLSSATAGSI